MIAVIDYGMGNLFSVAKAFDRLGADVVVTNDASVLRSADKAVLPGVGAFGDCMRNLAATGLIPAIHEFVSSEKPFLGICLGLQLLFENSEESPGVQGLGIFQGRVKKIVAPGLKIPHMGWNSLELSAPSSLFSDAERDAYVYFVHSYHAVPADAGIVTARTEYGGSVTAAVGRGNVQAMQFHPEKSGEVGLRILKNFVAI